MGAKLGLHTINKISLLIFKIKHDLWCHYCWKLIGLQETWQLSWKISISWTYIWNVNIGGVNKQNDKCWCVNIWKAYVFLIKKKKIKKVQSLWLPDFSIMWLFIYFSYENVYYCYYFHDVCLNISISL